MMRLAIAVLVLVLPLTARADYYVKDGNGNLTLIKSSTVGGGQMPQSIPSAPNGTAYSRTLPMPVALPGGNGSDSSGHAPSLGGLTLLRTMDGNTSRAGLDVGCNCAAGLDVVLDDDAGLLSPTIIPVNGGAADGLQGGGYSTPYHSGRVRIYSSNANCQYWARQWSGQ